jgi:hypothetical protein
MIDPKALEAASRAVADLGGFKSRTFPENIAQAALTEQTWPTHERRVMVWPEGEGDDPKA